MVAKVIISIYFFQRHAFANEAGEGRNSASFFTVQ